MVCGFGVGMSIRGGCRESYGSFPCFGHFKFESFMYFIHLGFILSAGIRIFILGILEILFFFARTGKI